MSKLRNEFIDITSEVEKHITETGAQEGVCFVYVPHTTAGITVNEGADPLVQKDILSNLARLFPQHGEYAHREGNSDAHIKATLVGSSLYIPFEKGKLALGTWQAVYFCEFDGPRHRKVIIKVLQDSV
jgi:secondary thiamine-phosphate synthase enzyme